MCEYCTTNSGTYDLTQRCCRARFTADPGHSVERRLAWCKFWRETHTAEEAEATIELARQLWAQRTSQSRPNGPTRS